MTFNLGKFLNLSLSFKTLTILKNPGESFCGMPFKSGLASVPLRVDPGYVVVRNTMEVMSFLVWHIGRHRMLAYLTIYESDLHPFSES